jgi:hypothetical protein
LPNPPGARFPLISDSPTASTESRCFSPVAAYTDRSLTRNARDWREHEVIARSDRSSCPPVSALRAPGGSVAGWVETVSGRLGDQHGSFALQQFGTMRAGSQTLHYEIVPGSGQAGLKRHQRHASHDRGRRHPPIRTPV